MQVTIGVAFSELGKGYVEHQKPNEPVEKPLTKAAFLVVKSGGVGR